MSREILIVEDEASVGESLSETLSQQEFDCQTGANGEEALERTEHDSRISSFRIWRCQRGDAARRRCQDVAQN